MQSVHADLRQETDAAKMKHRLQMLDVGRIIDGEAEELR